MIFYSGQILLHVLIMIPVSLLFLYLNGIILSGGELFQLEALELFIKKFSPLGLAGGLCFFITLFLRKISFWTNFLFFMGILGTSIYQYTLTWHKGVLTSSFIYFVAIYLLLISLRSELKSPPYASGIDRHQVDHRNIPPIAVNLKDAAGKMLKGQLIRLDGDGLFVHLGPGGRPEGKRVTGEIKFANYQFCFNSRVVALTRRGLGLKVILPKQGPSDWPYFFKIIQSRGYYLT